MDHGNHDPCSGIHLKLAYHERIRGVCGACAQQRSILPMTHVSWVRAMGKEAT
jgi:hypothetical protein